LHIYNDYLEKGPVTQWGLWAAHGMA